MPVIKLLPRRLPRLHPRHRRPRHRARDRRQRQDVATERAIRQHLRDRQLVDRAIAPGVRARAGRTARPPRRAPRRPGGVRARRRARGDRGRLGRGVPREHPRRARVVDGIADADRAHRAPRQLAHRGDHRARRHRRSAVRSRARLVDRDRQRLDPVRRRRGARPRRRDRHLHHATPRLRTHGRGGADHHEVRRPRDRTDSRVEHDPANAIFLPGTKARTHGAARRAERHRPGFGRAAADHRGPRRRAARARPRARPQGARAGAARRPRAVLVLQLPARAQRPQRTPGRCDRGRHRRRAQARRHTHARCRGRAAASGRCSTTATSSCTCSSTPPADTTTSRGCGTMRRAWRSTFRRTRASRSTTSTTRCRR